jgi:hypothetical protein
MELWIRRRIGGTGATKLPLLIHIKKLFLSLFRKDALEARDVEEEELSGEEI